MKRTLALLTTSLLLASCGILTPNSGDVDENFKFNPATDRIILKHEVRGDWLTTVGGYDWPDKNDPYQLQLRKLKDMIHQIREAGCNVVFFQVVSNMDAMYESELLPWSHVLTGTQGQDPIIDPLREAVLACREEGLQIHAWINPLRAGAVSMERCPQHVVLAHPEWIQRYGNNYYLDPGLPEVRQFLANIVDELMSRYDLDGIHIDDYFYPDGLQTDPKEWDDNAAYNRYLEEFTIPKSKEDWRFYNIDECVRAMYGTTHRLKSTAIFGVSPAGRRENSVKLYADPYNWVRNDIVDYLVPQIYWPHGHKTADFKQVLDSWQGIVGDHVPMFTGLAAYRLGETGFESMDEFIRQVNECREASYVQGHVWFRTVHILDGKFKPTLQNVIYKYGSLVPKIGKSDRETPGRPVVSLNGTEIQWAEVPGAEGYAVYELSRESDGWHANLVYSGPHISYKGQRRCNYAVLAYAGKEKGDLSEVTFIPSE